MALINCFQFLRKNPLTYNEFFQNNFSSGPPVPPESEFMITENFDDLITSEDGNDLITE